MSCAEKLNRSGVNELKNNSLVASNPKRIKSDEFAAEFFRVEKGVKWILFQRLEKKGELLLGRGWQYLNRAKELPTVEDMNHARLSSWRKDFFPRNTCVGFSSAASKIRRTNSGLYAPSSSSPTKPTTREFRRLTSFRRRATCTEVVFVFVDVALVMAVL